SMENPCGIAREHGSQGDSLPPKEVKSLSTDGPAIGGGSSHGEAGIMLQALQWCLKTQVANKKLINPHLE
ncbi:hypothetical protein ACE8DK_22440, partial [Xanthomonas euvesicatoria pv. euvesicatoria]|uniref:hypothetical protein n=1 Tax=Xanthomonas euvesicatoria TaxID=456327 RepID=UPI003B66B597